MTALPQWLKRLVYNQERNGDASDLLRQARHWRRWTTNGEYRRKYWEMSRLAAWPRYTPTTTTLMGRPFEVVDAYSYLGMYRQIFEQEAYRFATDNRAPYIIDAGANVGVSVAYFKHLYPDSVIVAFEPDESVFACLRKNVRQAGFRDVELYQLALWSSETSLTFLPEGGDGGRLATAADRREKRFNPSRCDSWTPGPVVRTTRLRPYLRRPVAMLKLDVEGAEYEVLTDCADLLGNVEHIYVEYHSVASEPQRIGALLELLSSAGFRLQIHQVTPTALHPFVERYLRWGMDMQLDIYGTRRELEDTRLHSYISRTYARGGVWAAFAGSAIGLA